MAGTDEGAGADDIEWWTGAKARVFISCGQGEQEKGAAANIRDLVRQLGFCPYLAIEVHSFAGLTDGIYQKLSTADYFLFADFARETLSGGGDRRGSLFSNQELGIASFLGLEALPFFQDRIPLEGILRYVQGNPLRFSDVPDLLVKIRGEIVRAGWRPTSRKELSIERDPAEFDMANIPAKDANGVQGWATVRYYHFTLQNHHWRTLATDCIVHVPEIRTVATGASRRPDVVELKFKHVTSPVGWVPASSQRQFDGIIIPLSAPSKAILGILNPLNIDSGSAVNQYTLQGPGDFEFDLVAFSREFRPAKAIASLHLGQSINDVTLNIKAAKP
ncbi:MAG: hypothetical protein ACLQD9_05810 [Thermoplasmata archaeon]